MKKRHIFPFAVAAFVVLLDQITKFYISSSMSVYDSTPVIDGFFNITYVRNAGAAFGFLAKASPMIRSLFLIGVTIAVILLIIYYIWKIKAEEKLFVLPLSLILGGAVGNLIDRIRFGEVIDFLDFYIGSCHWPAFNVADSAISVGAIILVFEMFRKKDKKIRSDG
ncbi:MAG: lipoprotein signal peptidase [Proteobacteria bacterium]|nr:lipoprotein signal peptidase [Pseudomonadota bacterium]